MTMHLHAGIGAERVLSLQLRTKGVVVCVSDRLVFTEGCGWAFAGVGAIESINAIVTGSLVSLSEQEVLDCYGSGPLIPSLAYYWVIDNGGIAAEADYPYTGQVGTCKANKVCEYICDSFSY